MTQLQPRDDATDARKETVRVITLNVWVNEVGKIAGALTAYCPLHSAASMANPMKRCQSLVVTSTRHQARHTRPNDRGQSVGHDWWMLCKSTSQMSSVSRCGILVCALSTRYPLTHDDRKCWTTKSMTLRHSLAPIGHTLASAEMMARRQESIVRYFFASKSLRIQRTTCAANAWPLRSRFDLVDWTTKWLSSAPDKPGSVGWDAVRRVCSRAPSGTDGDLRSHKRASPPSHLCAPRKRIGLCMSPVHTTMTEERLQEHGRAS